MSNRRPTTPMLLAIALGLSLAPTAAAQAPADALPTGAICDVFPGPASPPAAKATVSLAPATPSTAPDLAAVPFDLVFIDLLMLQDEAAVATAQIAVEQAEHPELRDLAVGILATQTAELAQLQAWRDAWYPNAPERPADELIAAVNAGAATMLDATPVPNIAGMTAGEEIAALCAAARNGAFDLAYIDRAIPRREAAIAMANVALEQAEHPELRELANSVIDAQRAELDRLREWRAVWS